MFYSSSHVQTWETDHKEGWVLKYWCFWTVALETTVESPLDSKEIKPVNPKYSLERLLLKLQYFGHLMWRANSLEKTLMLGKTEGGREDEMRQEDEMVGWPHRLNGHEFEQTPGDSEGQRSLERYSPKSQTRLSDWTTTFYSKYVLP